MGLYRSHEGAHLDGDPTNNEEDNLAYLCRKRHRAHDRREWAAKFSAWIRRRREERIEAKDNARPITRLLALMEQGLDEAAAAEQLWKEQGA